MPYVCVAKGKDMFDITSLARPEIVAMQAYSSARREADVGEIWLNANENPFSDECEFNRYPDPQPAALRARLAEMYQVAANELLITRGSDEAIDILLRTFCRAGQDAIVTTAPSYGMYAISAQIQAAKLMQSSLLMARNFALDLPQLQSFVDQPVKLIFLCSPNNPTGNVIERTAILQLCQHYQNKAIIVVDEAYLEFSAALSLAASIKQFPNLVVLRTLSKAYGLAALRCGSVLAHADLIALLAKVLAPYPIPAPVADAALASLQVDKLAVIQAHIASICQQRQRLTDFLNHCSFVEKVWPSAANFILIKVNCATQLLQVCAKFGIILRNRSKEHQLDNCVRISIGTPKENDRLIEVLQHVTN
jgi:histidinol-phosphate aminotransferase